MKKKKIAILLVIALVFAQIMPVYAATATGSNASVATSSDAEEIIQDSEVFREELVTSSDADFDEMYSNLMTFSSVPVASASDADYGIMLLSDSSSGYELPDTYQAVTATVALDKIKMEMRYWDTNETLQTISCTCTDLGFFEFELPDDFVSLSCFVIWLSDVSPASGQYLMTQSLTGKGASSWSLKNVHLWSGKYQYNVKYQSSSYQLDALDYGGKFMSFANIEIGHNISFCLNVYLNDFTSSDFPFSGWCKVSFEKLLDSSLVDYTTAGGSYSSSDATAQNTAQIAQNTADVNDTLKEIITHISDQLAALWDQMYNYMHVPQLANDDKNTGLITDSIETQMENDDENTDEVTTAIEDHGNFIIDGLKSLFIPSDEFFKAYFDDLYEFFGDRFGFLSFPLELLAMLVEVFVSSEPVDCVLTLPSFEIMGEPLLQETSFNFTDFLEENFSFLLEIIRFGTSVCLIGAFIHLCGTKWNEVMRN